MVGLETTAALVARRLGEMAPSFVSEFLGDHVALVPVPRSNLQKRGALWPALEIANELHALGLGSRVIPCLQRRHAVTKAATAAPKERPKAQVHFESLELRRPLDVPRRITLVDDVVTRGAQLFGAALCVWASRPDIALRAFAVIRTITDPTGFSKIADPCIGSIQLQDGECFRVP